MDETEIAIGGFVVSGCEASSVFELVEAAFDHVAQGVDRGIDGQLDQAVPLGGDHCHTAAGFHVLTNEISIITFVAEQHFWCWPVGVHDGQIALEVRDFAAGKCEGYGQAHRIDAEMNFGRKATF